MLTGGENVTIGNKIKDERKKAKLTQAELANKAGISTMSIRRYESGDRSPSYDTLVKLSDVLGVPISTFLTDNQLELRKEAHAMRGLQAILESMYDVVNLEYHYSYDSEGEPTDYGGYTVTLSKDGTGAVELDEREFEALLNFVRQNIPAYINVIQSYEPDNYRGE